MNRGRTPKPTTYTHTFYVAGFAGWRPVSIPFKLNHEMVPCGEDPRTFRGYPTLFHALTVASTTANIGLIYQASRNHDISRQDNPLWFGDFLVFDTGMKPFPVKGSRMTSRQLPPGVINVHFTNLERQTDVRTWTERTEEIGNERLSLSDIYPLAKRIVEDFAFLPSQEIHANSAVENKRLTPRARLLMFRKDAVNIDYFGGRIQSVSGPVEDLGYTQFVNTDSESPQSAICKKTNKDSQSAYMALVGAAFQKSHPLFLLSTLAHEAVHLFHYHRAAFLLERWRSLDDRGKPDFHLWVRDQSGRPNSGVTKFDFAIAMALCDRMNAGSLIHFEPEVDEWILKATYLPVRELNPLDLSAVGNSPDPMGLATLFPAVYDLIKIQMTHYHTAWPEGYDIVLHHLKPRLEKTFNKLSLDRRRIIRESLTKWLTMTGRRDSSPFLQWLFEIWKIRMIIGPT